MTREQLRVTGCGLLVTALSLSLFGCQFPSTTDLVSPSATHNPQPEILSDHPESGLPRRHISLHSDSANSIKIIAEIADEPEAQGRGLMGRGFLPAHEGMLFIFPEEAPRGFWMKDTLIPLDILFFDATGKWVYGVTMIPCEADPCPTYDSHGPAKYALEMRAGFIEEEGGGGPLNMEIENANNMSP